MFVNTFCVAPYGSTILKVSVEVNVANRGFPRFDIVGLAGKGISESRHRISTALANSGFSLPGKKIVVNLAPANVPKTGSFYDLPIALGLLSAIWGIKLPPNSLCFGEVSLDGKLVHAHGAFLVGLYAVENGFQTVFVPKVCVNELSQFVSLNIYAAESVLQLVNHLTGIQKMERARPKRSQSDSTSKLTTESVADFSQIVGQEVAKRALIISAAGSHNVLLCGPPGVGKTLLCRAYPNLLPDLKLHETLEVTKLYSLGGHINPGTGVINTRPFRSPHHTISDSGMLGGGSVPKPGEISLAHLGVLYMDEFPEFSGSVLESLRKPLEEGCITISRPTGSFDFPAKFTLLASCNPCPCGYFGHPQKKCVCSFAGIKRYLRKISGPLMDRFDMFVYVNPVEYAKFGVQKKSTTKSYDMSGLKNQIEKVRLLQSTRTVPLPYAPGVEALLLHTTEKFALSARAYFKLLKVAGTIADLAECAEIQEQHISEAISYRNQM